MERRAHHVFGIAVGVQVRVERERVMTGYQIRFRSMPKLVHRQAPGKVTSLTDNGTVIFIVHNIGTETFNTRKYTKKARVQSSSTATSASLACAHIRWER